MNKNNIYLGNTTLNKGSEKVTGQFVDFENEKFYKINNYNEMPDFFMTIVSDSDHWMYLSSNGSLSAGRKNRNNSIFPYYTVDKIHDYKDKTGSKTICFVEKNDKTFLWEPFTDESEKIYRIERNLYKSIYGNKIIFEELNADLEVGFQYGWYNSDKYGWVKKSVVTNLGNESIKIEILDGIKNILPYGVEYAFQNEYSNLLDAYKKNELLTDSKLGLFSLSSIPVDKAEPSEALKTTTVWSQGLESKSKYLISDIQVKGFKKGLPVETEFDVRASRGAYYINTEITLKQDEIKKWSIVVEVNQDSTAVADLDLLLKSSNNFKKLIDDDIAKGTSNLVKIVASADGLQIGNEELGFARHFSNTMFNIMRGGIFTDNYTVKVSDFLLFVEQTNHNIREKFKDEFEHLPEKINYSDLIAWAKDIKNAHLERICYEYLPLTFSRRHGDPSRPWNQFSIETKNSDGTDKLSYEGNWRDIFQNWEALSISFPEFIEGMISKFLNASTADGYNPYRITREGIDWEESDPDDPWSYIGYWGDHQIIYLLKFLELSDGFHPGKLDELMIRDVFVFANVPYRIKPFEKMVENPKDTILFDHRLDNELKVKAEQTGADGKLLTNNEGIILRANLTEKILITLLSKLSNFVPEAGIWMNTQRPEWNDANNALVGNGVSMVTLYYIRRFLKFWEQKLNTTSISEIGVAEEVKAHFNQIFSLLLKNSKLLENGFSNEKRYDITSRLGEAGTNYRNQVYNNQFSGKKSALQIETLNEFIGLTIKYIDQSIQKNIRKDGLYHAYNLISFKGKSISVRYLYEMLEGQVAVLSSGYLSAKDSLRVMDALKSSKLFRLDQYSYILYPDRQLPLFIEKNNIPENRIKQSALLQKLKADKKASILTTDKIGNSHFNGAFRNAAVLNAALLNLARKNEYEQLVKKEKEQVLGIYEEIFDHQSFTGRSGTFYGYEGLGSIYWHMVSKLLLAVQECYFQGINEKADAVILGKIKDHYYEIKAGIGLYKSPELYGAFPTDAYSHTPANSGVKQPGLTGQVKEDFLARFGELGVHVKNGEITFDTSLLNPNEILKRNETFSYIDLSGNNASIKLKAHQLGFTFCQIPFIYTLGNRNTIIVQYENGERKEYTGNTIPQEISSKIFNRNKEVKTINIIQQYKT